MNTSTEPATIHYLADRVAGSITNVNHIDMNLMRRLVDGLDREQLRGLVIDSVVVKAHEIIRRNVDQLERNTGKTRYVAGGRERVENLYLGKYKHGSDSKKYGAIPRGCECEKCLRMQNSLDEIDNQFFSDVLELTRAFAADMKVQWEKELLESTFALGDGTAVKWGDATIAQHEQRREMLVGQATGTLKTAALHEKAIMHLSQSGSTNLQQMIDSP